ncbi:MAG: diadenylate cyclase [Opitutales bacterium]|nr:diadenylate cyclase [Opitutales bacterium]
MRLDRLIKQQRIVDLQSVGLAAAVKELLKLAMPAGTPEDVLEGIAGTLMTRKTSLPGRIDNRLRLACCRSKFIKSKVVAIGRFCEKVNGESGTTCVLVIFLSPERTFNYPEVLAELVAFLGNKSFVEGFAGSTTLREFRRSVISSIRGEANNHEHKEQTKISKMLGQASSNIAIKSKCSHFFLFADTFATPPPILNFSKKPYKLVVITSSEKVEIHNENGENYEKIVVSSFSAHRLSQLRSAIFIGLMHGILKPTDLIACLGGNAHSNRFDTFMIVNVHDEFPTITEAESKKALIPAHIEPEVIEKTISLAADLAVEGREGKSVGSMFIIGRLDQIRQYVEPLIMNPFNGYADEDKNIKNPFMRETVKELALIDGAFVIDGEGVIDSAGSFVKAAGVDTKLNLPGGLGTRHAAACAISSIVDCVAIVVSSSGQVTLFRNGEGVVMLERSHGRAL